MNGVDDTRDAVFARVRECLRMCVGDGGHLYGYTIDPETFDIRETTAPNGRTEYTFRVDGRRDDEFVETGYADQESIEGAIVLDRDLDLTFGPRGRVQLEPHTAVHPRFWEYSPDWADMEGSEPPDGGLLELEIPELAAGAYNPVWWRPATRGDIVADVDRLLEARGEAVVLIGHDVNTDDAEGFEEAMIEVSRTLENDNDVAVNDTHLETTRAVFRRSEEGSS